VEEACGLGVGEAVTDMSSSWGDLELSAVVNSPWVGDVLGDVVLWAELQFIDMGPSDVEDASEIK